MSREKIKKVKNNLNNPFIQRVIASFEVENLSDIARFYGKIPQNLNGYINRGTLLRLIRPELIKRGINVSWVETGQGDMMASRADPGPSAASDSKIINELALQLIDRLGKSLDLAIARTARPERRVEQLESLLMQCEKEKDFKPLQYLARR